MSEQIQQDRVVDENGQAQLEDERKGPEWSILDLVLGTLKDQDEETLELLVPVIASNNLHLQELGTFRELFDNFVERIERESQKGEF